MNRLKNNISKALIVFMIVLLTSCYGSFNLTQKLYKWNGTLGDKFVNTLVFYGLLIVPVYEIATFADFVVFNTVEFWSGKNPVNMAEGESETKVVHGEKSDYEITAVKNKFIIKDLNSEQVTEFVFNENEKAWYIATESGVTELVRVLDGEKEMVELSLPDGQKLNFELSAVTDREVVNQAVKSALLSN